MAREWLPRPCSARTSRNGRTDEDPAPRTLARRSLLSRALRGSFPLVLTTVACSDAIYRLCAPAAPLSASLRGETALRNGSSPEFFSSPRQTNRTKSAQQTASTQASGTLFRQSGKRTWALTRRLVHRKKTGHPPRMTYPLSPPSSTSLLEHDHSSFPTNASASIPPVTDGPNTRARLALGLDPLSGGTGPPPFPRAAERTDDHHHHLFSSEDTELQGWADQKVRGPKVSFLGTIAPQC